MRRGVFRHARPEAAGAGLMCPAHAEAVVLAKFDAVAGVWRGRGGVGARTARLRWCGGYDREDHKDGNQAHAPPVARLRLTKTSSLLAEAFAQQLDFEPFRFGRVTFGARGGQPLGCTF